MLEGSCEAIAKEGVHAGVNGLERVKVADGAVESGVEVLGVGDVVGFFPALLVGEEFEDAVLSPLRELVAGFDAVGVGRWASGGGGSFLGESDSEGAEGRSSCWDTSIWL